jgi:alkyl hydroperoxide reductase subunit AhpC
VAEHGLGFAVGYGLDAQQIASRYGAFFEGEKKFLHATGFLIKPDGRVCNAVYSPGPIGRLTAADSLRLIDYFQKQKA